MLSREMYTDEYIQNLYKRTGNDPALVERWFGAGETEEFGEITGETRWLCK